MPNQDRAPSGESSARRILVAALLGGLAIRLGALWELADLPTFERPILDAAEYLRLAGQIRSNGLTAIAPFYQAPLFPYLLAGLGSLGLGADSLRLLQAVLGVVAAWALSRLAGSLYGRTAGTIALAAALLFGPLCFYGFLLLKPVWVLLALALFALLVLTPDAPLSSRRAFGAGLALGVAILLRQNLILLLPLPLVLPGFRRRVAVGAFAAGLVLVFLPFALINASAGGSWLPLGNAGGANLFIGNAEGAWGSYRSIGPRGHRPEEQREDARELAAALLGQPAPSLADAEVSRALARETGRQILEDPARWAALLTTKADLTLDRYELSDGEGYELYREMSAFLRLAPIGWGLVLPLAALGLWVGWREPELRRPTLFLAGLAALSLLGPILVFVFGRFRLPALVGLIPLAALGLDRLARAWRGRHRALLPGLGLAALMAWIVWTPAVSASQQEIHRGLALYNLGQRSNQLGAALLSTASPTESMLAAAHFRERQAVGWLERALVELPPTLAPARPLAEVEAGVAYLRLGRLVALAGQEREAMACWTRGRELVIGVLRGRAAELPPSLREPARQVLADLEGELNRSRDGSAAP